MSNWKRSRWASFFAFGCVHAPCHDISAVNWMLGRLRDLQPDYVVCLGDLLEASPASRWPSEDQWELVEEYKAADAILAAVREAAPNAKRIFTEGNHEHNIRAENRIPKRLRSLCDYRNLISNLSDWEWHEYRNHPDAVRWVGPVGFSHGFASSRTARHREAYRLGVPNGLMVMAHDHRPADPERCAATSTFRLDRSVAGVGTLRDLNPEYMRRNDVSEWGHAVVYGEARTGRKHREKPYWSATCERMGDADEQRISA